MLIRLTKSDPTTDVGGIIPLEDIQQRQVDDARPIDQDANEELDPKSSDQGHHGTAMSGRDHSSVVFKVRLRGVNPPLHGWNTVDTA